MFGGVDKEALALSGMTKLVNAAVEEARWSDNEVVPRLLRALGDRFGCLVTVEVRR